MNILLTNDDGFGAPGLESLIKILGVNNSIYVCAPLKNRSGASQSINMGQDLELVKKGKNSFALDGSPTDCVMTGLRSNLFSEQIDVVISGINKGANIGTDIVYSGTCGAARQAVLYGIPGIAVSLSLDDDKALWDDESAWHYDVLSSFVGKNLENLTKLCSVALPNGRMPQENCVFVNINAYSKIPYNKVEYTDISFREYLSDSVKLEKHDNVTRRVFCYGSTETKSRNYSDYDSVMRGNISVSRVYAEAIAAPAMDGISLSL